MVINIVKSVLRLVQKNVEIRYRNLSFRTISALTTLSGSWTTQTRQRDCSAWRLSQRTTSHNNSIAKSNYSIDAHEPDKTTVTILNNEIRHALIVNSFSEAGFRLNFDVLIIGAIALFPQTVLAWAVGSSKDVNEQSLSLFVALEPKLDILVIGYGDKYSERVDSSVIRYLTRQKIYVELLPTEQACATYNFLAAEGRHVAAALLPPEKLNVSEHDVIHAKIKQKRLFHMDLLDDPRKQ